MHNPIKLACPACHLNIDEKSLLTALIKWIEVERDFYIRMSSELIGIAAKKGDALGNDSLAALPRGEG